LDELKAERGVGTGRTNKVGYHLIGWRRFVGRFRENRHADHLHCPGPNERPCEGNAEATPLLVYGKGARVCITSVCPCGWYGRLMEMGVVPGEEVMVHRRLSSNTVGIEVKGCEVRLSPMYGMAVLAAPCL